jgi:cytochrome bd-type quinol oxidase subunit 2
MRNNPYFVMLVIAAIPVVGFLLFFNVARKDRERQPWEERATYVAYGILALLLVSLVVGRFMYP